ncbi:MULTISPECIES: tetratricopeptide repeat protein [unclassified Bradyrhizobium]|uniref:tetratricopeptide repeat protein n=1 Tax=unclassified Bradyrhizobium TaxID=2631580 RepID=UPI0028E6AB92|nr:MULTISPECIES: tetratricopeptide repeat protein [unclassified Bradyrhizobium]
MSADRNEGNICPIPHAAASSSMSGATKIYPDKRPSAASFEVGLSHHRAGRFRQAEDIYREILASQPDHADSSHLLGVALFQVGDHGAAIELIKRAIELQPKNNLYHANLAGVLRAQGRQEEAIASYHEALRHQPDNLEARNHLGSLLGECGDLAGEEAQYRTILRQAPSHIDARLNLANLLARVKRFDEAICEFRELLRYKPDSAAAYNNFGALWLELNALDESEPCFRSALQINPNFAEAYNNLGLLLAKVGLVDDAEFNLREACNLKPHFPEAFNNLGDLLRGRGNLDESEACCREALRLRPDYPSAQLNLGNALREAGRFHEAEACYELVLASNPVWPEALNNMGSLLFDLGRPDEAIARFQAAVAQKPDYADAHANMAIAMLLAGQFEDGWLKYEWRWKQEKSRPYLRNFSEPMWDGGDIGDRVLLLHAEQGLGDTLQFCRYVPQIVEGRRVILEVQSTLVSLLERLPGIERIVARGEPLPHFDLHCPLLSLPRVLGTTLQTIPSQTPYLRADPQRAAVWRRHVEQLPGLRVGLVWAGNETMGADQRRSVALERLSPLTDVPGVSFVSLQKGPAAGQPRPRGLVLHDWTAQLTDFGETAALAEALDLIISVDTAAVHLAGALGRPVWLLNRFDRCWRWLLNRDDSPWYPTLRQFRQPRPGDWSSLLVALRAELCAHAEARAETSQIFDIPTSPTSPFRDIKP